MPRWPPGMQRWLSGMPCWLRGMKPRLPEMTLLLPGRRGGCQTSSQAGKGRRVRRPRKRRSRSFRQSFFHALLTDSVLTFGSSGTLVQRNLIIYGFEFQTEGETKPKGILTTTLFWCLKRDYPGILQVRRRNEKNQTFRGLPATLKIPFAVCLFVNFLGTITFLLVALFRHISCEPLADLKKTNPHCVNSLVTCL